MQHRESNNAGNFPARVGATDHLPEVCVTELANFSRVLRDCLLHGTGVADVDASLVQCTVKRSPSLPFAAK